MRAWKWGLAVVSWILGSYAVWSCLVIARAGAAADIPQLEAAGAAELTAAIGWLAAGCLSIWRLSVSAVLYFANALWAASLAFYYQDDMVWLWSGACALLGALTVTATKRGNGRPLRVRTR
ncbi:hypothetical protein [Alicyclobacillus mali (ex Roth et al. 2021)]|uniref:hypothetical protein n=1 Tax=Alicyclobacillus mali (ex Roth et al. 2021) TaxID=1123961 RepID=UPI001A8F7F26|nr:hypothetical protein [Alicyclobacillus mali (ex Roth et al. 2021)]